MRSARPRGKVYNNFRPYYLSVSANLSRSNRSFIARGERLCSKDREHCSSSTEKKTSLTTLHFRRLIKENDFYSPSIQKIISMLVIHDQVVLGIRLVFLPVHHEGL